MISIVPKGRDIPSHGCGGHPGGEQCFFDTFGVRNQDSVIAPALILDASRTHKGSLEVPTKLSWCIRSDLVTFQKLCFFMIYLNKSCWSRTKAALRVPLAVTWLTVYRQMQLLLFEYKHTVLALRVIFKRFPRVPVLRLWECRICMDFCHFQCRTCSTSLPGGNLVDGLPPVAHNDS